MKVLIFLPTYNEKENIAQILELLNDLDINKEILIVDDNSNDGTLDIINKLQKKIKNLTLIRRTGKRGRGLAGITALKYFIQSDSEILIEMDADLSHHPKYIPYFLKFFPKYDVIIGSRSIESGDILERKKSRKFISLLANIVIRFILSTRIRDCTSGFRAFKKNVIKNFNLNEFISINPEIVEEILYACVLSNAKIKEVPITFYKRAGGESKLNFKKIFYVFTGIVKIRLRGKIFLK